MTYIISSPEHMIELGHTLNQIGSKFLVHGTLGAGKTHLCKGFAQSLGINPSQVHSPTYVYYHEYDHKLFHGDFYRINDETILTTRGIIDVLEEYDHCFIERPNFAQYYGDPTRYKISIEHDSQNENIRAITITPNI